MLIEQGIPGRGENITGHVLSFLALPPGFPGKTWAQPRTVAQFAARWKVEIDAARALGRQRGVASVPHDVNPESVRKEPLEQRLAVLFRVRREDRGYRFARRHAVAQARPDVLGRDISHSRSRGSRRSRRRSS